MIDQILEIIPDITSHHMGILLLLGVALFGGTIGGGIFRKLKVPKVVGYIMVGMLIGQTGFAIVNEHVISILQPFSSFALGLIGFMIGGELKKTVILKHGKQFLIILLSEGLVAFFVVTTLMVIVGNYFFDSQNMIWALALLLGAIASATAPAATTDVLWEYKTRGPLTSIILGIVALDDGLALLLFAFASSMAGSLLGEASTGAALLIAPAYEVGGAITLGVLVGLIFSETIKRSHEEESILAFSVGSVVLLLGLAEFLEVDSLIASMTLGAIASNYRPNKSKEIFQLVQKFTPPIYVLFFVLFGAKLNLTHLSLLTLALSLTYLIGRTCGKFFGARFGAKLSKAPVTVQKYLPLCLFSQAGVAIGLSVMAGGRFPEGGVGDSILVVITTTTFVVQIFGPISTKIAVTRAGEVGKDFTEEELIHNLKVEQIINRAIPKFKEDSDTEQILKVFSEHDMLYYPVVDNNDVLVGILTIDDIKNMFFSDTEEEQQTAADIMSEIPAHLPPGTSMGEVREALLSKNLEYMPIVGDENQCIGILEARKMDLLIAEKIVEIQQQHLHHQ